MINKNEILTRLANGEDAQSIADEIANTLNAAIAEHLTIQEKTKADSEKIDAANKIIEVTLDFLEKYYPDLYDPLLRDITGKELLEIIDSTVEEARKINKAVDDLDKLLSSWENNKPVEKKECKCKNKKVDPLEEFLAKYVDC